MTYDEKERVLESLETLSTSAFTGNTLKSSVNEEAVNLFLESNQEEDNNVFISRRT
jgi:hypothetical protein